MVVQGCTFGILWQSYDVGTSAWIKISEELFDTRWWVDFAHKWNGSVTLTDLMWCFSEWFRCQQEVQKLSSTPLNSQQQPKGRVTLWLHIVYGKFWCCHVIVGMFFIKSRIVFLIFFAWGDLLLCAITPSNNACQTLIWTLLWAHTRCAMWLMELVFVDHQQNVHK